ncbi:hypothetical protein KC351_g824 [Hortaea werneckii]|nr:hypothetical protein KC351_g824 [Hortaea werneckii]
MTDITPDFNVCLKERGSQPALKRELNIEKIDSFLQEAYTISKQLLRQLNGKITELKQVEDVRNQAAESIALKKRNQGGLGALGRWAAGGAVTAKSPEEAAEEAERKTMAAHRESVLMYLQSKLEEAGRVQSNMMEVRLGREMEKSKSVLSKSRQSAGGIPYAQDSGSHSELTNGVMDSSNAAEYPEELDQEQQQLLAEENNEMLKHYNTQLDQLNAAEKSILEISELQSTLTANIQLQQEHIDHSEMAPTTEPAPLSNTDAGEKPVREQLKKASIAGMQEDAKAAALAANGAESEDRGRLHRKRSFEQAGGDGETTASKQQHTRKRSRDSKEDEEEEQEHNGKRLSGERERDVPDAKQNAPSSDQSAKQSGTPERETEKPQTAATEAVTSPKTKRSRIHSTTTDDTETGSTRPSQNGNSAKSSEDKVPASSGFANTSASSPFASLASPASSKTEQQPQTSASAFASSGFGSLAGTNTSGFGAIGKTTGGFGAGGGFATGSKSPLSSFASGDQNKESDKSAQSDQPASTFGGALGQKSAFSTASPAPSGGSAFGSSTFGGSLGASAFSSLPTAPGGNVGGLTSFASGKPTPPSSTPKPAKPFGAPPDPEGEAEVGEGNEAEEDAGGSGVKSPAAAIAQEDDPQDERFFAQQVETGEEEEQTVYSSRAKLYEFVTHEDGSKGWRERGLGVLRLNVHKPEDKGTLARFLMRADGSHRVVLNTPVKKEISFGAATGGPPQAGLLCFLGTIDGKSVPGMLQLKMKQQFAMELYEKINEIKEEM